MKLFNALEHGHKVSASKGNKQPRASLVDDLALKKTKKAFMDYLVKSDTSKSAEKSKTAADEQQTQPKWNVLQKDYMLKETSLNNWDEMEDDEDL